jgi:hypothetical protein
MFKYRPGPSSPYTSTAIARFSGNYSDISSPGGTVQDPSEIYRIVHEHADGSSPNVTNNVAFVVDAVVVRGGGEDEQQSGRL